MLVPGIHGTRHNAFVQNARMARTGSLDCFWYSQRGAGGNPLSCVRNAGSRPSFTRAKVSRVFLSDPCWECSEKSNASLAKPPFRQTGKLRRTLTQLHKTTAKTLNGDRSRWRGRSRPLAGWPERRRRHGLPHPGQNLQRQTPSGAPTVLPHSSGVSPDSCRVSDWPVGTP